MFSRRLCLALPIAIYSVEYTNWNPKVKNIIVLALRAILAISCIVSSLPKQLMIGEVKMTIRILQSTQNEVESIREQHTASLNL